MVLWASICKIVSWVFTTHININLKQMVDLNVVSKPQNLLEKQSFDESLWYYLAMLSWNTSKKKKRKKTKHTNWMLSKILRLEGLLRALESLPRESRCDFQHLCGCSYPFISPIPWDPMPFSDLQWHCMNA